MRSLVMSLLSCLLGSVTVAAAAEPSNPDASLQARRVLGYLAELSDGTRPGVLCGQNTGHGDEILTGYQTYLGGLYQRTGRWAAVVGLDYGFIRPYTVDELRRANGILIDHWRANGLVTINWSPSRNPWTGGGVWDTAEVDLRQLVDPTTTAGAVWRGHLDRLATALAELRDAGVVVLWRPMQEMNFTLFWWGRASHGGDPQPFVALWRDMYRYFTVEKGLDNLLWVFAPISGGGEYGTAWAYPGDDVVDIVAPTGYNDELTIWGYAEQNLPLGKPLGQSEYGRAIGSAGSPDFDNRRYGQRLLEDYQAVAYWVSWHDWTGASMSLTANPFAKELLDDPLVLTREDCPPFHDVTPPARPAAPLVAGDGDAAPRISGSTESGAAVEVMVDGAVHATLTADSAGEWSLALEGIGDGSHQVAVVAIDVVGNRSEASPAVTVTVGAAAGAPVITAGPEAAPAPVAGTTTTLTVSAEDDGGAAALGFTWSASGPAPVAFSPDSGNAAAQTTATFAAAGDYRIGVTVRDGDGNSSSASLDLTVRQTATRLELLP